MSCYGTRSSLRVHRTPDAPRMVERNPGLGVRPPVREGTPESRKKRLNEPFFIGFERELDRLCHKAKGPEARRTRVYFAQVVPDGPIKIGIADDPRQRLRDLQCACPYELVLVGHVPAPVGLERFLHRAFAAHRLRGEWFEPIQFVADALAYVLATLDAEVAA